MLSRQHWIWLTCLLSCGILQASTFFPISIASSGNTDQWLLVEQRHEFFDGQARPVVSVTHMQGRGPESVSWSRKFEGLMHSHMLEDGALNLCYRDSVFALDITDKSSNIVASANTGTSFLALMRLGTDLCMLAHSSKNGMHLAQGNHIAATLPELSALAGRDLTSCSTPTFIAMLSHDRLGRDVQLHVVTWKNDTPAVAMHKLGDEPCTNVCQVGDEVWIMPGRGRTVRTWSAARGLQSFQAQLQLTPNSILVSAAKLDKGIAWLSYDRMKYQLTLPNDSDPVDLPGRMPPSQVRKHLQASILEFAILLSVLLTAIVLSRRHLKLLAPSDMPFQSVVPANLFIRSLALLLDLILISTPVTLANYLLLGAETFASFSDQQAVIMANPLMAENILPEALKISLVALVLYLLYHGLMDAFFSASIGKMFFRLRLSNDNGRRPTLRQVLIKTLLRPLDLLGPLGLLVSMFSPNHKSISDHAAKTIVTRHISK